MVFSAIRKKIAAGVGFGSGDIGGFFRDAKTLRDENGSLFDENNKLKKEIFELKEIRRENDLLRSFLDLLAKKKAE